MYRYYLTMRPPSIGTHPKGSVNTVAFDRLERFDEFMAWGYVEYDRPLTEKEVCDYELREER